MGVKGNKRNVALYPPHDPVAALGGMWQRSGSGDQEGRQGRTQGYRGSGLPRILPMKSERW